MIRRIFIFSALVWGQILPVYAQAIPDASRVEGQLDLKNSSRPDVEKTLPVVKPETTPPVLESDTIRFFVKDIIFDGATVYSKAQLDRLAAQVRRKDVSLGDLYVLVQKITDHYRADGYVLAQAFLPPQSIEDGVVRIQVIEPYIDQVVVEGQPAYFDKIKRLLMPWYRKKLLNVKDLEETLLLINDLPGTRVQSVLQPRQSEEGKAGESLDPGAIVLRLVFNKKESVVGRISFDNYGSKFIGPYQLGAHVFVDNAFGYMAETNIQGFVGSEWGELVYLNVGQNIPMQFPGLTLNLFANKSRVVPGYTLQSNDIKSRSTVLSAGLTQSVVRSRRLNFDLLTSLESRSSATKLLGDILTEDRLTILTMGGKLQMADSRGAVNSVNLTVRQGLNLMGARDTGSLNLSRLEGRSDFTSVQMQAARTQNLTNDLSVFGQIRGQYAFNPLLSSEEFGYGGNTIGRAFNASEIVGDHGVSGTVEGRYRMEVLPKLTLEPYVFYDIGKTWNLDRIDGDDFSGVSTGFGMRGVFDSGASFETFIAKPLTRRIETPQYGSGTDPVIKFSLGYQL